MGVSRVRDPNVNMEITATMPPSAFGPEVINLQQAVAYLNTVIPMISYAITRVGVTDVWNVTATAVDLRAYATTITITGGVAKYTLTSLPAGTSAELDAFLALVRLFTVILKSCEVSAVTIAWG